MRATRDDDDDDGDDDDDRVVSGEIDSAKDDDGGGGRDAGGADKALAVNRASGESASLWLAAAADVETTTLRSCWDTRNAGARATSSALDAETFDLAYRRAFRPVKGIDTEPVIASERDCAHVVATALGGCQTSADILVAAAARTGSGVRMRFASSSTLAFRNALKTMASAAERRCELDYAVSRMTTPYMRPVASAIRDILRAHAAALQAMPEATAERRLAERDTVDDLAETKSDVRRRHVTRSHRAHEAFASSSGYYFQPRHRRAVVRYFFGAAFGVDSSSGDVAVARGG